MRVASSTKLFLLASIPFVSECQECHAFAPTIATHRRTVSTSPTQLYNTRRTFLGGALGGGSAMFLGGGGTPERSATAATTQPLADLPMIRVKLPQQGVGREYVAVQIMIDGKGPFEFMVDSGLTTEMITPDLQELLGISLDSSNNAKNQVAGYAAGGATATSLVDLDGAALCCGKFDESSSIKNTLPLPKLHAVITDFPQEHIDPKHNIEGMLGMELLEAFDVEFDFPHNRIRFWRPGTADTTGLVDIPAVVINETGLIGIRVTVPGGKQPILGFLDCGATFSCMNWKAAATLGLPPKEDTMYRRGPVIAALGIDGNMMQLPVLKQTLSFAGDVKVDPKSGRPIGFEGPPKEWKDWNPVQLAIGDIPAFSTILGDGISPYQGPAALIGLDVLAQRRVILGAGPNNSRKRDVWVSPK